MPIASGKEEYPQGLIEALQGAFKTVVIDAGKIAEELGNLKTQNIVLFGALVKALKMDEIDWEEIIRETIKPKLVDINIKAYNKGKEI
jgi:indolepyruvate ferredoxin oxidoreductase beta subunit